MTSRTLLRAVAAVCVSLLLGCSKTPDPEPATSPAANAESATTPPAGRLDGSVAPQRYRIELNIDPSLETFSGQVEIDVAVRGEQELIWLHGKDLDVTEVFVTDASSARIDAEYEQVLASGVARLSLARPLTTGTATIRFAYSAPFNSTTNALFRTERDGAHYAATQFQPTGARKVFPGFDEPGFKVPFELAVVSRPGDVVITTTPEVSASETGDGAVRHVFETTRPLPTYLLAFAVGPYEVVDYGNIPPNAIRDRGLPLRAVVAAGQEGRTSYALENTEGLLSVLEEYFGTPYPYRKLDLIAMPESFGGAMENVGAITYDEYLLLMDDSASLDQRRLHTIVHAHEIGHMWFGNLVTPDWWTDIWLNESFASWIMNKAAQAYWPEGEFDRETLKSALGAMNADSLAAAREIREPIDTNEKIAGAFDAITYSKGGGVLAMLERYVGEDRFRDGIRLHMDRFADRTATAEDFIASVAEGSERVEIEAAFKSYIEQPGVPLLDVQLQCEAGQPPHLRITQTRYAPLGSTIDPESGIWQIPMCASFVDGNARTSVCGLLEDREQTMELGIRDCPSRVHPNADGAGYYRFTMDNTMWQQLIDDATLLPAAEALSLADSLDAAFQGGKVSADTYVDGMVALVNHDAWDVADAATSRFESILDVIRPADLARVEAALRDIVRPRYARLAESAGPGVELLEQRLQRFLIVMAKDPDMRAPLARQSALRLGLNGDRDPSAVPPGQLETVLSVGVQDLGQPFFDLLLDQSRQSSDPAFRSAATGALARVEEPALVARLQDTVLEGEFKGSELIGIVFRQMVRDATTDLTYEWLRKNDEAVLALIPETFRSSIVPALGAYFCSTEKASEWQLFVEGHADKLPGYERELAQAVESVQLCAALREARGAALADAFARYAIRPRS